MNDLPVKALERIVYLEEYIRKLKCCGNCFYNFMVDNGIVKCADEGGHGYCEEWKYDETKLGNR